MKGDALLQRSLVGHRHDEMFAADGSVRPYWKALSAAIANDAGGSAATRRAELTQRLVVESDVTFNDHANPGGADRPWLLDPLPLLISTEEWNTIKTGIAQRARLLDALMADLYGAQILLKSGRLPTELAFGHPNFLWPAQACQPVGGRWLHIVAFDLARAPDGRWQVLADRTQSPAGLGYALEHREIIARVFPALIGELAVRPLTDFFSGLRESLLDPNDDGIAVVLTPGPLNEAYFEHSYLARQLGLPLVEGTDLAVRDSSVFLKTLAGLKPVQAILRRVNDAYCDPLELRGDSLLGVPGLMAAVRAGSVRVANAPGSGVLESPAWLGFLPGLASDLIGEPLQLPSVGTWWCGEASVLPDVLANLDHLLIKATTPENGVAALDGRELTPSQLAALRQRISAQPSLYVAQERVRQSQAPAWNSDVGEGGWANRALAIRVFAMATPSGYKVMPGALGRIAGAANTDTVTMHRGGGSKDVWVLSDTEGETHQPSATPPRLGARSESQSSRMVENLFWFGRYSERCEDKARLLRATINQSLDPAARRGGNWNAAIALCRHFGVLRKDGDADLPAAVFDPEIPFGLYADVRNLARCGVQARSQLSAEHWRTLIGLQQSFSDASRQSRDPLDLLDKAVLALTAMAGFTSEGMTRDEGWNLLMLGRRIERCVFLSDLLTRQLGRKAVPTAIDLGWLLDIGDSTITHRTRYREMPRLATVFDLMLSDSTNPRGLPFLIDAIGRGIVRIEDDYAKPHWPPAAAEHIAQTDALLIEQSSPAGDIARQELASQIRALLAGTEQFADWLNLRYFVHADTQQPLQSA